MLLLSGKTQGEAMLPLSRHPPQKLALMGDMYTKATDFSVSSFPVL